MNTIILLDLENTIIWDWTDDPRLVCNQFPILKEWVQLHAFIPNARVGIFSWAIWNQEDINKFNRPGGIREEIEITHEIKIDDELIFPLDDLVEKIKGWRKFAPWVSRDDITEFFKKREMMEELWLREFNQPNTEILFLDDTVPNLTLKRDDVENNTLELIDPWTLIHKGRI